MNNNDSPSPSAETLPIGEKIKRVRKASRLTQKIFAESLGIAQGFLCAIERGRKKPSDTLLIAMQHTYNINRRWLFDETGTYALPPEQDSATSNRADGRIPLIPGNAIPSEISAIYTAEEYISLPGLPTNCFAIKYTGDFMSPTIRHGDIVVISPDETPTPGKIALITGQWDEPFLRRYRAKGGKTYYTADNSAYSPCKANDITRVLGVVHSVWRRINI